MVEKVVDFCCCFIRMRHGNRTLRRTALNFLVKAAGPAYNPLRIFVTRSTRPRGNFKREFGLTSRVSAQEGDETTDRDVLLRTFVTRSHSLYPIPTSLTNSFSTISSIVQKGYHLHSSSESSSDDDSKVIVHGTLPALRTVKRGPTRTIGF